MDYKDFNADEFARDAFFIKWVKGDPESQWFWSTFLSEHPSKTTDIEQAREMVALFVAFNDGDEMEIETRESMRKQVLMSLKARREREKENAHAREGSTHKLMEPRFWVGIAASLALFVSLVSIWYWTSPDGMRYTGKTVADRNTDPVAIDSTEELRISHRGQKSVVLLADGTKVWLNADTKLTYAKNFGEQGLREVYLEGEAFFDVVRNPDKPFIVHTRDLNIKVLGTSFNVKSYDEDAHVETTLVKGKVEIDKRMESSGDEQPVILQPNQRATFSKASQDIDVEEVVTDEAVAWRRDRLVFRAEPLREVIKQLGRWYNVNIHVENPEDLSCPLTANIEKESLIEVLDLLAVTHKISFTIDGKEVSIKGSICH